MSFIANNLKMSGTFKVFSDTVITPTTWSETFKGPNVVLSNGDLTATTNTGTSSGLSVAGVSSGKYYWENMVDLSSILHNGVATIDINVGSHLNQQANAIGYSGSGNVGHNGTTSGAYGDSYNDGDIISTAIDMDTGELWFAKNGVWQSDGDPATGTNSVQDVLGFIPLLTSLSSTIYAAYGDGSSTGSSQVTANFGASSFVFDVPDGFNSGFGEID